MDSDIIIVLIILSATVIMLVLDIFRIDIVAIGCMLDGHFEFAGIVFRVLEQCSHCHGYTSKI